MVSVVSTAVSFGVLALVFGVLHLWGEIGSTVFANVVATVPSYLLNRNWVWGKGGRSHLMKEIVPFWSMSAIGIVVSIGGAAVARHIGIEPPPQPRRADRAGPGRQRPLLRAVLGAQVPAVQPPVPCAPARGARRAGRGRLSTGGVPRSSGRSDRSRPGRRRPTWRGTDDATVTHSGTVVLVVAVFLASTVEMVEALTIVLAVGRHPGWRSALERRDRRRLVAAGRAGGGPRPGPRPPGPAVHPAVWWSEALLLVFGLQWLRKAVLRAAGLKAKHDEDAIFDEQVAELSADGRRRAATPPGSRSRSKACSSRASRWW